MAPKKQQILLHVHVLQFPLVLKMKTLNTLKSTQTLKSLNVKFEISQGVDPGTVLW